MIRVMALPDWRAGNNYQGSLGRALAAEGFEVAYPHGYRRALPLARTRYGDARLLHLHWPEYYFQTRGDRGDWFRRWRYPLDLALATRRRPLIYTAHNLLPHDGASSLAVRRNYRSTLARAAAVIAHSATAARQLAEFCPAAAGSIHVVPHGDPAEDFPTLPPRAEARRQLQLDAAQPVVLLFGRAEPYKGLEEVIAGWSWLHPAARLWIAGTPKSEAFARELHARAAANPRITLELRWISEPDLAVRLAAADAVLFNYRRIFTSGAGCLARSLGRKIVLPAQLDTIDLMEPAPTVFRFRGLEDDLPAVLARAVAAPEDPAGTKAWRAATGWREVARRTAAIYRQALG